MLDKTHGVKTKVIGIGSGKGGVGKTTFAVNLATVLQAHGHRVLIFDADLGLANIHIAFKNRVVGTMVDVFEGRKTLGEIIIKSERGIHIISGGNGLDEVLSISKQSALQIIQSFSELEGLYDYMIVDVSAGIDENVMTFLAGCDHKIVLGTEEPSSIADAYALIKMLTKKEKISDLIYVPNKVRNLRNGQKLFNSMNQIVQKFLGESLHFVGSINFSSDYNQAWSRGVPAVSMGQSATIEQDYKELINELERLETSERPDRVSFFNN
jgi:flagellar biosynthesis protein FlhG